MLALQIRAFLSHGVLRHGAFLSLAATMLALPAAAEEKAHPTGRLVGTVTVVGTNEPVPGATIGALTGQDGTGIRYAQAKATSDARGRYSLEFPMGHAQLFSITPPPGYWAAYDPTYRPLVTTPDEPERTQHFQVQRGAVWRICLEADADSAALLPGVVVIGHQFTREPYFSTQAPADESGHALLTFPEIGGDYDIAFYHTDLKMFPQAPAKLSIEAGFRPDRVVPTSPEDGAAVVFEDEAGRKATLTGRSGAVVDGHVEITVRAAVPGSDEAFAVTGMVVDEKEQPLPDALVALGSEYPGGAGAMTGFHARTNGKGRFVIDGLPRARLLSTDAKLRLMVKCGGLAGVDTPGRSFSNETGDAPLDFGTVKLSPGYEARLRVLDPDGKPVLGAWVEPQGSYSARSQFARTDAEGRCALRGLAPGIQKADVRFGRTYAKASFVVTSGEPDEVTVRLAPLPEQPAAPRESTKPLAAGEEVPEWEVVAWTDGQERKLSDFRGKVVVINLWGIWCSSCVYGIPGLQDVQQRFRDEDVVFLGIHTAGTDLGQIRKLMQLKDWDWPTGLDAGEDATSGRTVERYGIRAFATTLVVGRDGRIVFTTDDETLGDREAVMEEVGRIAKELGIAWPFPEDMTPEEGVPLMNRIFAHRLSEAVEAALKAE